MNITESHKFNVLLADDDSDVILSGRMLLEDQGWKVTTAKTIAEIVRKVEEQEFDIALLDMNYSRDTTSGEEGLELISKLKSIDADLPIVVMTAWATIDIAVEAVKRGACDFIHKPWENDTVVRKVTQFAMMTQSMRRNRLMEAELRIVREESAPKDFIAHAPSMQKVMEIIRRIGPSDANVLILGENGTGKSVIARIVHHLSNRREGPFINVNMGGLVEGVFESEIFGHVKGAFTDAKADRVGRFELAKGGTIFLDEIGNITLSQQNRLLHLLETGEFERVGSSRTIQADVRVISATNAPLKDKVANKEFREDLFYRLNTVILDMPSLRNRKADILPLALHFLELLNRKYCKQISRISASAQDLLQRYSWPGNVRELNHTMERAVLMCEGEQIESAHLLLETPVPSETVDFESMDLESIEKLLIQKALKKFEGNVTQAAKQLGLSRATFYRRLQDYGL